MADLALTVTIRDLDVQKAAAAFLRKCPIPQIDDPDSEMEGVWIDEFPNTRDWVEEWLRRKLLRAINKGIQLQSYDITAKLTKDIFLTWET